MERRGADSVCLFIYFTNLFYLLNFIQLSPLMIILILFLFVGGFDDNLL